MFNNFSLPKKLDYEELNPLNLPKLPLDQVTFENISNLIKKGIPIWTWTNMFYKCNISAIANMCGNVIDGFAMFRKEYDLLIKYIAVINANEKNITLKTSEICKCNIYNINKLINTELHDAIQIYYDDKCFTERLYAYIDDYTLDDIHRYLQENPVLFIEDEHFIKKPKQ